MGDRACMAIIKNGLILMVRQTYRDEIIWTFPGGGIELGETPVQAAVREVAEEVNLQTEVVRLLHQCPRQQASGTYYCYLGRIVSGQVALGNDPELAAHRQELHEVRWQPLDEVRTHPEVFRILDRLIERYCWPVLRKTLRSAVVLSFLRRQESICDEWTPAYAGVTRPDCKVGQQYHRE